MKQTFLLIIMWGLLLSCAGLPKMYPAGPADLPDTIKACEGVYPVGDWQLLHTIEAALPGSRKGFLMGLTVLSSRDRSARCIIMTLEGFVLFDAQYDGQIKIERAVAPFDSDDFARGLMEDIHLIFFRPPAAQTVSGSLDDGTAVCRYHRPDGRIVDLVNPEENRWELRLYRSNHRLMKSVNIMSKDRLPADASTGIADKIELTAHGSPGYKLVMDLVEARPIGVEGSKSKSGSVSESKQ